MVRSENTSTCYDISTRCQQCDVRAIAICGALENSDLSMLERVTQCQPIPQGSSLIDEGESAVNVYTLLEGMLKLYKLMPDGRRQVTGFLIPGDFIGLAFGDRYIYTAEAVVPTKACRFKRSLFHTMLEVHPLLERRLLSMVSTELAAAQEQILLLGRKTARERLSSFLLVFAKRLGIEEGELVGLPMSRSDIADYLGLTVETISRTFTNLRKDGLISGVDKNGYVIVNQAALAETAGD